MSSKILVVVAALAATAVARLGIGDCTYYDSVINPSNYAPYNTRIWYVPDTGEICEILDCGGGRAPPKTTVPGCANYQGTDTYSPKFIDPKTLGQAPKTTTAAAATATATTKDSEAATTASGAGSEAATPTSTSVETLDSIVSAPVSDLATTLVLETAPIRATPVTGDEASGTSGAADNDAASTPAPTSVSTAGGAVATAGGVMALVAGAAVYYAGLA